MDLQKKIQKDLKIGLKKKEKLKCSVLRLLISAIHNKEIEKKTALRKKGELGEEEIAKEGKLTNEEIIEVIGSEIKRRKEAILGFEKGKRTDLVEKEKREIEILQNYLPEQLSEEEIKQIAKETIEKVGAKELRDIGRVMAQVMPKVKGRAEGGLVSRIVKELLSQL